MDMKLLLYLQYLVFNIHFATASCKFFYAEIKDTVCIIFRSCLEIIHLY